MRGAQDHGDLRCDVADAVQIDLEIGDVIGEHAALKADVENAVVADLCDADGNWTVDYVRLRFKATKVGG